EYVHAPERRAGRGAADAGRLRRVPAERLGMGSPAPVPHLRPRGLLRLVAQPPRHQALPRDAAPHRHLRRTGRGLVVVLRRPGAGRGL
ncbi:MAG: Isopeptidase T, partial [uncultured Gemmatimonadetes bacterium]